MFTRIASILIIGFWLVMTGLLVHKEVRPGSAALREVPVEHVIKLLLMHGQASDLGIYNDKMRLGNLRIHPHLRTETRGRSIDFSGRLQVLFPGADRQRVEWAGTWDLEKNLATRHFELGLITREAAVVNAPSYRARLTISPADNLLTWTMLNGDSALDKPRSYTLDEAGLQKVLGDIALDPTVLSMIQGQKRVMKPPVVRAQQSSMLIHGERIDTYLVTVEQSGQTLLEFDVSQLGTILRAKTLGYSLAPDDLMP
jgi:hypothetical protein